MDGLRRVRRAVLLGMVVAGPVAGQEAPPRTWSLDAEVGASLLFGASDQAALLSRARYEQEVPRWELGVAGSYDYGETQDPDEGRFVSKRAWSATVNADYLPAGRFSPFLFATGEGSLERQIDSRVSGGVGGRYRFVDGENARVDLSIAALLERTDSRRVDPSGDDVTSIGRWSARFRVRRTFSDERMTFDLVSYYRPRMGGMEDYTIELATGLQYALTSLLGVKLSLVDTYDSQARSRGARSNNDGRLLFSVNASVR